MRDWQALVRLKFSRRGLTREQQNEITVELAAHLEDVYEETWALGTNEADATCHALDQVADWRKLSRKIRRSKQKEQAMNSRTKRLWLPGLASLTAAMGTLMLMNNVGVEPKIFWYRSMAGLELYVPWLVVLPVFGALGAYLSQRGEGKLGARLAAALFPAIAFFGLFCLGLTTSVVVEHHLTLRFLAVAFALITFNWVLVPGAALFLGALPFLRGSRMGSSTDFQIWRQASQ